MHVSHCFPDKGQVLDFGAGTGDQSVILARLGYEVSALDVEGSDYSDSTVFPVSFYGGKTIPFPDNSFDFIFSSNVLEHIRDATGINHELKRVLRPGGRMVHIVPSASWRFWTSLTAFPDAPFLALRTLRDPRLRIGQMGKASRSLVRLHRASLRFLSPLAFRRHGEWGNAFTELRSFGRKAWCQYFFRQGYDILKAESVPLFYTGALLLDSRLTLGQRQSLSRWLGASCHLFVVSPQNANP